jgi:hypothetical protein
MSHRSGPSSPSPPGPAPQSGKPPRAGARRTARDFFDVYTKDLKPGDLQRLFTRDAREAYEFFARGVDRTAIANQPPHLRFFNHIKLFFLAFTLRLSAARRAMYGVALVASILGLLSLFDGVATVTLPNGRWIPLPIPHWREGWFWIVLSYILLNALIVMEVADRLSLKHDLNVARDIQLAMLPGGTYRSPGLEIHGETRPANTVGGDFYDLLVMPDGRVLVALGDVAGKGSPAALLMALLLAILRTLVDEGLELAPMAERLNGQVTKHAPPSRFITLFVGFYDPATSILTWVNAGQNPPMIRRRDGQFERLEATGVALGMFEGMTYEARETVLSPGDWLVMYSDGITEAENADEQPFDEAGLAAVVSAWVDAGAPELTAAVLRAVDQHVGDARIGDDLTVLALKRH